MKNLPFIILRMNNRDNTVNFKIIAIRTGIMKPSKVTRSRSSQLLDALKNLKGNQIYSFRNEYKFPKNDFSEIDYNEEKDINLYHLKTAINHIPISINAIVGSNGSGKSTLIELLYWANYNIGINLDILGNGVRKNKRPFNFLDFELIYSVSVDTLIKLVFKEGKIYKQKYKSNKNKFQYYGSKKEINRIEDLSEFFYTVVVNYSHYALNSEEIGDWIISLFHKNDGYQTPIVLNPMRIKGDIDINKEKYLLTRRLIANILEPVVTGEEEKSLRNIVNNKIASSLELTYTPNATLEEPINAKVSLKLIRSFKQYFNFQISQEQLDNDLFVNVTLSYIHKKLIKMTEYKTFRRYRDRNSKILEIKDINAFIKRIHSSDSHIVFKAKGAILYLKYYKKLLPNISFKEPFNIQVSELSDRIREIGNAESFHVNTYMMAPPSYFNVNIIPDDGTPFGALSSGEKQKIHSISSIVYHLININSVEQLKEELREHTDKLIHYNYVNIVLDEIELYYHPEWQRTYIADLIDYIGKINPENLKHIKGVNITFLTHSPYILSDIPDTYILKLLKGSPVPHKDGESTFGANIHDLLANDFFMRNGFMGEWAKRQIEETIKYLNLKQCEKEIKELSAKNSLLKEEQSYLDALIKEKDVLNLSVFNRDFKYYERIVELIGEPVIKNKIRAMYSDLFEDSERKRAAKKQIQQIASEAGLKIDLN
jgi:hypothetical protein